jgi:membrane protein YqaA with SNARE-associated domain
VTGGILGYAIGFYLFETIGQWIIQTYDLSSAFAAYQAKFQEWGFWIIVLKGLTPIPYKLVTIASGVASLDFRTFVIASAISRGFRFFFLAGLLWYYGPWIRGFIERYLGLFFAATLAIIVIGFVIVKLLT